jgi:hypothetical protein
LNNPIRGKSLVELIITKISLYNETVIKIPKQ